MFTRVNIKVKNLIEGRFFGAASCAAAGSFANAVGCTTGRPGSHKIPERTLGLRPRMRAARLSRLRFPEIRNHKKQIPFFRRLSNRRKRKCGLTPSLGTLHRKMLEYAQVMGVPDLPDSAGRDC